MKVILDKDGIKIPKGTVMIEEIHEPIECEASVEQDVLYIKIPRELLCKKSPIQQMIEDIENAVTVCDVETMAKALEVAD